MPASRGLAGAPRWAVLETGFGLGLNFLATWQAWRSDPRRPACLFYSAVEAWVCKAGDLVRSAAPLPSWRRWPPSWPPSGTACCPACTA
jgi:tRNA 5-methylaminomethyl-2-thiouridine biosynthesis bifunctional protein